MRALRKACEVGVYVAVGALVLVAAVAVPAQAADTIVYTQQVHGFDANQKPEMDSFSLGFGEQVTVPVPFGSGLTPATAGNCRRITASSKYDAPVGTLWTFTSGAVYCFKTNIKVTYFAWDSADGHVTQKGQLAGWRYDGATQSKSRIDACRMHGNSTGHFDQHFPFVGTVARQDAPQSVIVNCHGGINWS